VATITTPDDLRKKRSLALILSPIGLLLISAARLIIVSDYNTTTAVTIASSGGYINTLLGSIIPLVPIFAPYLALILLLFRRFLLSVIVFIFTAFITPSPVTLREVISLAVADWHRLVDALLAISPNSQIFIIIAIIAFSLLIIAPLWEYHRSFAEVASAIIVITLAAALLLARSSARSSLPVQLRLASQSEGQGEHQLITFTAAYWPLALAIGLSIVFLAQTYSNYSRVLSAVVAIVATFALFPYVASIYPFPHKGSYYSEVLHELWLPAERIVMRSGHTYYGYILASDLTWDTVLLTNRTIVYLPTNDVVHRSVCQPRTTPQPAPYPPLIPLLYSKPSPTSPCAPVRTRTTPTILSIVSHGQSLKAISLMVGTWPWHITSLTNAVERDRLSPALRAYESAHNWNAPTPKGQRFWYPPRIAPLTKSHGHRHVSRTRHSSRILGPHPCDLRPVC